MLQTRRGKQGLGPGTNAVDPCLLSGYLGSTGVPPGEEVRNGGPLSIFTLRASEHQAGKGKLSPGQATSSLTGASTAYWGWRREQES